MKFLSLLIFCHACLLCLSQSLTHITGKRLYEHHSTGVPTSDIFSQSGYDFVNNNYYSSQSYTVTYNSSHIANIDMVEYGGVFTTPQNFGFSSDSFTSARWIRANGTTKWHLAPSGFNYNTISNVTQIMSAYNSTTAGYFSSSVSTNQIYLGRIRNSNIYVAMKITNVVNTFPNPPSIPGPNQYFDFEYKYGVFFLAPSLVSPVNMSIGIKKDTLLKWRAIANASAYDYQLSTSNSFSSTAINTITDTFIQVNSLSANTQYFWRVRSQIGSNLTDWSNPWSFVTRLDTSVKVNLLSPMNNILDLPITPQRLTWLKLKNVLQYEYQVSTDSSSFQTVSSASDTSIVINGLSYDTRYFWRVRGIIGQDTSGWSSIWSFVTKPTPPITPQLISPSNLSIENPIVNRYLKWTKVNNATLYDYQFSASNNFSSYSSTNTDSFILPVLSYQLTYYWRVRARNHLDTSSWTSAWSFTTKLTPPQSPILISPSNLSIDRPLTNILSWNPSTNATQYDYQYSEDMSFINSTIFSSNTNIASINFSKYNAVYYWRVRARNHLDTSSWSDIWNLATKWEAPLSPNLIFPANQSQNIPIQTQFSWFARKNTIKYEIVYSLNPNFIPSNSLILSDTAYSVSLQYYTNYYWKVRSINRTDTSSWSATWSFGTRTPVKSPILKFPIAGTQKVPITTYIKWTKDPYATVYDYQISLNSNFSGSTYSSSVDTITMLNGLQFDKTYYWRVRSRNNSDTSLWTETSEFKTKNTPPSSPELVIPNNNSIDMEFPIEFSWTAANNAEKYDIELSNDEKFNQVFLNFNSIRRNQVNITCIPKANTFYWRVRSRDFADSSGWSNVRQFKVKGNFSHIPENLSNSYQVYPNPTNGIIQVNSLEKFLDFELINVLGEKIELVQMESINNSPRLFLIPEDKSNGIYYLKITDRQTSTSTIQRIELIRNFRF